MALLGVLVLLLVITGSSTSFIWFMNQQQTRAGARLRSAAAMALAEAGVHRALAILESVAPDGRGPGRTWREEYSEALTVGALKGSFTLSLADGPGGVILITSIGEVGGVTRGLRVQVYLASTALLAALYGASVVQLDEPPAVTSILPYGAITGDGPWVHIAAGGGVWFATTDVSLNQPALPLRVSVGPAGAPLGESAATPAQGSGSVRILLARGAKLMLDREGHSVNVQQLQVMGVNLAEVVLRAEGLAPPEADRAYYQSLAAANTANASVNAAAGSYFGDRTLAVKQDSLYAESEFDRVQIYLMAAGSQHLQGMIYVRGQVMLFGNQHLQITDGALIAENTVHVGDDASLEITHSARTRTLPGLIVLNEGGLLVTEEARLRVHGLVYASRVFDIGRGARVDIVGSVVGRDTGVSIRNGGVTVIRYDRAVLGTPGLRVPDGAPVVAWVAAWEELP